MCVHVSVMLFTQKVLNPLRITCTKALLLDAEQKHLSGINYLPTLRFEGRRQMAKMSTQHNDYFHRPKLNLKTHINKQVIVGTV